MKRALLVALTGALLASGATAGAGETTSLAHVLAAKTWLQGHPTAAALSGKVVILDVFTVDCINCRNVTPNLRALHAKDGKDLAIIGIHTPETPAERNRAYVVQTLHALGITWPVAVDNDSALWNAYGVEAWPTQFIFDRQGRLRKTVVGDSQDDVVDETVRGLLREPATVRTSVWEAKRQG
ncbi:MAG: redoxin domain-containing protein [Candidatus Eremiobacteraeota bacterium]|nr:redoxin domain-containing protein [Candidatus Eremiobacteraeota bacterium]